MALVDLTFGDGGVIVPEDAFRQICTDLVFNEKKLHELLRIVILTYVSARRRPGGADDFKDILRWVYENYIELRENLPGDLKRLYLSHIAFPVHDNR